MPNVCIYALNCPVTGRTRYIGKAEDPYRRYEGHLESCKREHNHKSNWIRSLLRVGDAPQLEILDLVPIESWQFWEKEYIRLYRMLGFDLVNGTDGGEGLTATEQVRKKMSNSMKGNRNCQGRKMSEHTRELIRIGNLGKLRSLETRKRVSESMKGHKRCVGRVLSEETKLKLRIAILGKKRGPYRKKGKI